MSSPVGASSLVGATAVAIAMLPMAMAIGNGSAGRDDGRRLMIRGAYRYQIDIYISISDIDSIVYHNTSIDLHVLIIVISQPILRYQYGSYCKCFISISIDTEVLTSTGALPGGCLCVVSG